MPVSLREKKVKPPSLTSIAYSRCSYSIAVRTSCESPDEIDASVYVQLTDASGRQTDKCRLSCSITHRVKFQKGHSDLFMINDQPILSDLANVVVFLQKKSEKATAWKLHSVNIIRHTDHTLYRFPCGQWLGKTTRINEFDQVRLAVEGKPYKVLRDEDFEVHE